MSENNFSWLYPDLMSKKELVSVLRQRYIQSGSLDHLDKHELVELYNKYIIPLPQRKYRVNRRGQEMTKKQFVYNKKHKLKSSENAEGQPEAKRRSTGRLLTSFEIHSAGGGDRLKPPPSCINTEHKKIKLSSSSSKDTSLPSLDRLKINRVPDSGKQSPKKIKLSNGPSTPSEEVSKKNSETDNRSTSPMDCSTDEDTSKKKKKITKISWP